MLAVWAYRKGKDKWAARRNNSNDAQVDPTGRADRPAIQPATASNPSADAAPSDSTASAPAPSGAKKGLSSETKWNLMLMGALAIPVFLETLDYTGKTVAYLTMTPPLTFPSSRRHCTSTYCCTSIYRCARLTSRLTSLVS